MSAGAHIGELFEEELSRRVAARNVAKGEPQYPSICPQLREVSLRGVNFSLEVEASEPHTQFLTRE